MIIWPQVANSIRESEACKFAKLVQKKILTRLAQKSPYMDLLSPHIYCVKWAKLNINPCTKIIVVTKRGVFKLCKPASGRIEYSINV